MSDLAARLRTVASPSVKAEARQVLAALARALEDYDLSLAPMMTGIALDDGSFVVEWILDQRRMGLTFDPNPRDSGWFFVTSLELGNVHAYGRFQGFEVSALLALTLGPPTRR